MIVHHDGRQYWVTRYGQAEHWEEVMTTAEEHRNIDIEAWLKERRLYARWWVHVVNNWGAWVPIAGYNPALHGSNPETLFVSQRELDAIEAEFREWGLID